MIEESIRKFGMELENITSAINNLDPSKDVYEVGNRIEELETFINNMKQEYLDIEEEINDELSQSNTKPLLNKLNIYKSELGVCENNFNKKKDQWDRANKINKFKRNELTGVERARAERDMLLDQHKETDLQGEIIDNICYNVKSANQNMIGINSSLDAQGEQINRIQQKVMDTEATVKQSNQTIDTMTRRHKCMKILTFIAIIIFGIFDLAWIGYWLWRKFGTDKK